MSLKFACEACGAKLAIKDGAEGRRIKCPKCGASIGVPVERPVLPIVVDSNADSGPTTPHPSKPSATLDVLSGFGQPLALLKGAIRAGRWYWLAGLLVGLLVYVTVVAHQTSREPAPAVAGSGVAAPESHALDPNHPDYGGIVLITLITNGSKKMDADPRSMHDCYRSLLTPNEQKAWIFSRLGSGADTLLDDGFEVELPAVIRLLRDDINTPASRAVADQLAKLIPIAGKLGPYDIDDEAAVEAHVAAFQTVLDVNQAVELWRKPFTKDVYRFFYDRWRQQGEDMFR